METNLDRSGAAWDVVDLDLATMVELDCPLRPEQIFLLNLIARYDHKPGMIMPGMIMPGMTMSKAPLVWNGMVWWCRLTI